MAEPCHVPVDTSVAVPAKSILKKKTSITHSHTGHSDTDNSQHTMSSNPATEASERRAQWDEMNILATYHPAGKEYGHMKIEEAPTPYHEYEQEPITEGDANEVAMELDPSDQVAISSGQNLRERKASFSDTTPEKIDPDAIAEMLSHPKPAKTDACCSDSDDDSKMSEEQRVLAEEFKNKRKQHYNEFQVGQQFIRVEFTGSH